jgi:hypothetical protein
VILHLDIYTLPIPRKDRHPEPGRASVALARSIAGLGLTRRRHGSYVVYTVLPRARARS